MEIKQSQTASQIVLDYSSVSYPVDEFQMLQMRQCNLSFTSSRFERLLRPLKGNSHMLVLYLIFMI